MKRLVPAFLTLFLSLCGLVHALDLPDRPSSRVSDYASMFSPATREKLEIKLAEYEKETSNQIAVVTAPSLDGLPLEDVSIKLAEKWKLGTAERDNGVLIFFSKADRAVRIEVGYGLEGALPDALAKRIIENEIIPSFKQGDFDGGLEHGVDAVIAATRGEYKAGPYSKDGPQLAKFAFTAMVLYFMLPIFCYMMLLVIGVLYGGTVGFFIALAAIPLLMALRRLFWQLPAQTYSSTGKRGWRRGLSGGGFSGGGGFGGGGGSFGGGGASGRW